MKKISLFTHREDAPKILKMVQQLGILEFTNVTPIETVGFEATIRFLTHYEPDAKRFTKFLEGNQIFTTEQELTASLATFNSREILQRAAELETHITHLQEKLKLLHEEKLILNEWRALSFPLDLQETARTAFFSLNGMEKDWIALKEFLMGQKIPYELAMAGETKAILIILKEHKQPIQNYVDSADLEIVTLPPSPNTAEGALIQVEKETAEANRTLRQYEKEATELSARLALLKRASDYSRWEGARQKLIETAPATKEVFIFEGWCPDGAYKNLEKELEKISSRVFIETIKPEEKETPPIAIKNPTLVKPFESITELYGLPSTHDLDPTLFLAGFFFIFFGLSLTDVGYGATLALLTGAALLFFKLAPATKKLVTLLFLGGFASILIGFIFGGYFGIDIKYLPVWLQELQRFDPIANPLPVLYLTLGLGVLQVAMGLILKIARDAKEGALRDGLLDQMPWLALFISLAVFGGTNFGFFSIGFSTVWLVWASLIAIVITQGRKEKGLVKKLLMGLVGLYGFVGYFSDILSYSRLLALGLATTALAFAVNLIAGIIGDMIPYVGFIFMYAILIVGHIFNLLVNVLGAFIHSARLQFVEFFSKFITGTGRAFNAFRREGTYVVLK